MQPILTTNSTKLFLSREFKLNHFTKQAEYRNIIAILRDELSRRGSFKVPFQIIEVYGGLQVLALFGFVANSRYLNPINMSLIR
ncbi:MAG: hypothetical protein WBE34_08390 [Candidatus Nitrosopolaris sp.]